MHIPLNGLARTVSHIGPSSIGCSLYCLSYATRTPLDALKRRLKNQLAPLKPGPRLSAQSPSLSRCSSLPSSHEAPSLSSMLASHTTHTFVISRYYEPLNIFFGYEQYNRYAVSIPSPDQTQAQIVGYIVEQSSVWRSLGRQLLGAHRPLLAYILDLNGQVLVEIQRPWTLLTSHLSVYRYIDLPHNSLRMDDSSGSYSLSKPDGRMRTRIGEVKQVWHLWKRMYDLFVDRRQFGSIESGWLSWDFAVLGVSHQKIALITRHFGHLLRELFTDSGQYCVSFESRALTEAQKWTLLATAVSIDFDYFSRHSKASHGGFGWPFFPLSHIWPTESSSTSASDDHAQSSVSMPTTDAKTPTDTSARGAFWTLFDGSRDSSSGSSIELSHGKLDSSNSTSPRTLLNRWGDPMEQEEGKGENQDYNGEHAIIESDNDE